MLILNVGNGHVMQGDKAKPTKAVRVRLRTGEIIKERAGGPEEAAISTGSGARSTASTRDIGCLPPFVKANGLAIP